MSLSFKRLNKLSSTNHNLPKTAQNYQIKLTAMVAESMQININHRNGVRQDSSTFQGNKKGNNLP